MKARQFSVARLIFFTLCVSGSVWAQTPTDEWENDVKKMLTEFLSCTTPIDDVSPCNVFLVRALDRVYGISDFSKPGAPGNAMTANEIASFVEINRDKWTLLGEANKQNVLDEAQGYANRKKAIIAVKKGSPHGHVAMIIPGAQVASGAWGLKVPNSASFFLGKPNSSYVGKGLSFAWTSPGGVKLYGRNF